MNKQSGVSRVVVVIALALGLVIVLGLVIALHGGKKSAPQTSKSATAKNQGAVAPPVSNQLTAADGALWTAPPTATVDLAKWGVHMTLPAGSVGNVLFRYDTSSPIYVFSTKQIAQDPSCVVFYNNSISPAGLEMQRYTKDFPAQGTLPDVADSTTLDQYYTANKASDGDYFVEFNNGDDPTVIQQRWYKVGSYFYTINMPSLTQSYTKGFAQYCTQSPSDYYTQFGQMLTTIQSGLQ